MHSLSIGTWFIHLTTLFEWLLAIIVLVLLSAKTKSDALFWFGMAMIPNLISAMAAITWHLFDNSLELSGLVVLQAALTVLGNSFLAIAAWNLVRVERKTI